MGAFTQGADIVLITSPLFKNKLMKGKGLVLSLGFCILKAILKNYTKIYLLH